MHDNRELVENRIARELHERVLPLVHVDTRLLRIEAGPDLDHLEPFEVRSKWGAPWATTWFRFSADIPDDWAGHRVEAVIDLGFHPDAAGFQCEGLIVDLHDDGTFSPLQGIHPRRTNYAVDATPGPVQLHLEAASNPSFPGYRPSRFGSLDTAGDRLLYTFRRADLVVVDRNAEALAYDLDVLDGLMRSLALDDPRRSRLLRTLADALDRLPDVAAARRLVAPALAEDVGDVTRHRSVAIGHAHIDTAWLWPMRETVRKCIRTFASAVALMDDYPEYVFAASSAQHYAWIEERHPELFEKIADRVERGQWEPVGGMWVESDMNLPSGESLVRQIVFGQRYFEETFGRRCTEVWIPDVFGYPAGLPQVFALGGMDRFVTQKLSWNKQNVFPHSTFWWEGLDGTRVLTHFPPVDTYNAEVTPAEFGFSVRNFKDHGWSIDSLMPFGHGDGGGGPTREMVERSRRLGRVDSRATLELDTPSTMFERIERDIDRGAPAPVWRGELYFEMHRGTLTSQIKTKLGNRRCERLLVEAELWAATLGRSADVDDLWKAVLTQQFHDILPGSSIAWVHEDAERIFSEVEAELQTRIGELVTDVAGPGLSVANRADVAVAEVVVLDVALTGEQVQQLSDGRRAAHVSVPAFGVVPLVPEPVADRVVLSDTSMSNGRLAVRWDRAGNITSIIDLDHARELVPEGERAAVLELAVDHPVEYDAWDVESWTRANGAPLTGLDGVEVEVTETGPLVGRLRVRRVFGPSVSTVTYQLRAGCPQLDVHVELDWHHDEHLLSMAFPLDVRSDTATCDVQFGVVERPTHPSSPWDAAKFEVCAHRFVDVAEPDFGVAIINDGRFGHGLFDGAVRVSLARAANYPDPNADRGHHEVTLAVRPHGAGLADVRAAAARLNSPLRVVDGGRAPAESRPIVTITDVDGKSEPTVEVDAVKLADDGSGDLIVRLHEAVGNRTRITVATPDRVTEAWRCDLLEEEQVGEEVGDGVVTLTLRPFQIVTLRLRRSATDDGRTR